MKKREKPKIFQPEAEPMRTAAELSALRSPATDPDGSYTGCPVDPFDRPVQDADDL